MIPAGSIRTTAELAALVSDPPLREIDAEKKVRRRRRQPKKTAPYQFREADWDAQRDLRAIEQLNLEPLEIAQGLLFQVARIAEAAEELREAGNPLFGFFASEAAIRLGQAWQIIGGNHGER